VAGPEVCALLLQGPGLEEIAGRRFTAPVTAKNQIAAILQKSGVSRRADLIRLGSGSFRRWSEPQ